MENIKSYSNYKPSGINWLGDIPEHWEIKKLKNDCKIVNGATPSTSDNENWDGNIIWVTPAEINNILFISNSLRKITEKGYKSCGTFLVPKNSIILTTRAPIGKIAISNTEICTNQGCKSIIPNNINYKFLYYQISIRVKELNALGTGTTFMELGSFELKNLLLIKPSVKEQTAITNFLDYKTVKIDRFIRKKKQLIKLLNEQKAGIINHAVTKGLDAHAKMKTSGIKWLGDIPEHWEVSRLKYIMEYFKGFAFKSNDFSEKGIPIIKASNIKQGTVKNEFSYIEVDNQRKEFESVRLLSGDIIITTVGSKPEIINSSVGQIAIIDNDFNNSFLNQNTMCVRPIKKAINQDFAKFFLVSKYMRATFDSISLCIVNQAYLLVDSIMNVKIVLPQIQEQIQIVEHIEKETIILNKAIATIEKEIALVQEYRNALIAEAVTGKIDVRGYQVPVLEEEDLIEQEIEDELDMVAEDVDGMEIE